MPKINNERFYTSAIEKFGVSARGLNWASRENQLLRFEMLLAFLPQDLSPFSLVDAGCGFGDFYLYLKRKKQLPKEYIGIDSLVDMCSIASQNTAQEIIHTDICRAKLPVADYYICSGALNVLTPFETQLFIHNCYNSSRKAFLFNALYGEKESQTYNYLSQKQIEQMARSLSVKKVLSESSYLQEDITIGFLR